MEFCKKLCKKLIFFFQNISVENSLICPRTKWASHCLTELFPIYQNNIWTIRRWDDHTIIPSSHRIILKIVVFLVKRPRARTSDLPEVIQPKSCESFYVHKENHIKMVDRSKMDEWNDQKLLPNRFFLNQSFLGCKLNSSLISLLLFWIVFSLLQSFRLWRLMQFCQIIINL